jgi:hypothetical protein
MLGKVGEGHGLRVSSRTWLFRAGRSFSTTEYPRTKENKSALRRLSQVRFLLFLKTSPALRTGAQLPDFELPGNS